MMRMDMAIPGSRILEIAKIAFAKPGIDLLCFGESDQPSPASVHAAAIAALEAGATRYPDVRGLPELRIALSDYLTDLHAKPVERIGSRSPRPAWPRSPPRLPPPCVPATAWSCTRLAWPNVGNAARVRGAQVEELALTALAEALSAWTSTG